MFKHKERIDQLFKQERTEEVVEELIKLNYGLLYKQLDKFYLTDDPDALSLGLEALYNSIMTFEPGKSAFSTYATVCIYNRLGSHVRSLNTLINTNTVSYETPVGPDGTSIIDKLESPLTADEEVLAESGVEHIWQVFHVCLGELDNGLHKRIVSLWGESGFTVSQAVIAETVGCTQTYVSQILKKFRNILKERL